MIVAVMGIIIGVTGALLVLSFVVVRKYATLLPITDQIANQLIAKAVLPVVIIAIILCGLSYWAVLLISHKIYGPLYRCAKHIKKLSNGEEPGELKFRKGDAVNSIEEIFIDEEKS